MNKIGFIGGGKIAQAMAKGFIKAGMSNKCILFCCCLKIEPMCMCVHCACSAVQCSCNKLNFEMPFTSTVRSACTHFIQSKLRQFISFFSHKV